MVHFYIYIHRFIQIFRGESTEIVMTAMVVLVKIITNY